jgi:hypothetical protein
VNEEFQKSFAQTAHESGMTKAQAQKAWNMLQQQTFEHQKNVLDTYNAELGERHTALKQEWGAEYDRNIESAKKLMNLAGDEWKEYLQRTGLGREPEFIKVSAKIGKLLSEDNITPTKESKGTLTPADANRQIEKIWSEKNEIMMDQMHPERPALLKKIQELSEIAES